MDMIGNNTTDIEVGGDAVAATLGAPVLKLFQVDLTPDRDTTLAILDAAEADYVGYVPPTPTWSAATISDDGEIEYQATAPEFRPTNGVTPNSIYGWYLTNTAENALLFCGRFDGAPLPMVSALDNIIITLRWRPGTAGVVNIVS